MTQFKIIPTVQRSETKEKKKKLNKICVSCARNDTSDGLYFNCVCKLSRLDIESECDSK